MEDLRLECTCTKCGLDFEIESDDCFVCNKCLQPTIKQHEIILIVSEVHYDDELYCFTAYCKIWDNNENRVMIKIMTSPVQEAVERKVKLWEQTQTTQRKQ